MRPLRLLRKLLQILKSQATPAQIDPDTGLKEFQTVLQGLFGDQAPSSP